MLTSVHSLLQACCRHSEVQGMVKAESPPQPSRSQETRLTHCHPALWVNIVLDRDVVRVRGTKNWLLQLTVASLRAEGKEREYNPECKFLGLTSLLVF